jgi:hypothetical protein
MIDDEDHVIPGEKIDADEHHSLFEWADNPEDEDNVS